MGIEPRRQLVVQALRRAAEAADAARQLARLRVSLALEVDDVRLELSSAGPRVSVAAPLALWDLCLGASPPPGCQSIGALTRSRADFRLVGEPLAVAQCLGVLEAMVETARGQLAAATGASARDAATPEAEPGQASAATAVAPARSESLAGISGRYLPLELPGLGRLWVYEESAGAASRPPMLLLHTAGADSRQWHGLMTDERLNARWRMLAFDMPFHGRSNPPLDWNGEPWRLDTARYVATLDAYLDAAGIARALIVGCSMGAAAGLAYIAARPERALGAILLEAPFRSPGRRSPFLDHPAVHAGRVSAAWVQALLAPSSPAGRRRRATWIYGQGGPGVYEGDLAFYSDDFDAADHVARVDTRRTPLSLLTGEYDYSAAPADSRRIADAIPGARFEAMPGLGHFPMVENPDLLMTWLLPAATAIAAAAARSLVDADHPIPDADHSITTPPQEAT
jgi:pimeloyl-ACP methyl ester carboxylesterase